jgi:hypothetical protein
MVINGATKGISYKAMTSSKSLNTFFEKPAEAAEEKTDEE